MLFLVKEEVSIAPAAAVIDIASAIPAAYRHAGPLFACLDFWLVTPEGGSPGGFSAEVRWLDPTGTLRIQPAPNGAISLATPNPGDPLPKASTGFFMVKRLDQNALFQLVTGVINPGSAMVGYSLMFGPAAPTDLVALP
jgi:hypothetical protein